MWNKIKKSILILNVVVDAILGLIILQISNLIYRYNRFRVWVEENELYNQFYIDMQDIILLTWLIWGALTLMSIVLLINEVRNNRV